MRRPPRLLVRERAEPERVALHLLRTEPAGEPATVATLREAARRAAARGAPQSAATYLRRALAEPPATAGRGSRRAARARARARRLTCTRTPSTLLHKAVDARRPRRSSAARSPWPAPARCGLAGHFDTAIALCRSGLEQPARIPPELRARLEAELIANAWLHAVDGARGPRAPAPPPPRPPPLELWRINAALGGSRRRPRRPQRSAGARSRPRSKPGALAASPIRCSVTLAKLVLIAYGELDAARAHCAELIDLARPRGWLIALAHGCFMRAIALVHAGEIRDAEADARLAFEFKLAHSPPGRADLGPSSRSSTR